MKKFVNAILVIVGLASFIALSGEMEGNEIAYRLVCFGILVGCLIIGRKLNPEMFGRNE